MKKINDENITQLRISLANVEPIKIPSNWKANIDIKGVITTNPHNPIVKSRNELISVKKEIKPKQFFKELKKDEKVFKRKSKPYLLYN